MKILTAPHMERCIGCLLCVLEAAKSRGTLSLDNPLIKIVKSSIGFTAEIDSGMLAPERVVQACPRNCLKVEDL